MARGFSWLPILTSALLLIASFLTYSVGVALGHVSYLFPYISEAGVQYPESSLFSFLFDVIALLILANIYVHHLLYGAYFNHMLLFDNTGVASLQTTNAVCLALGVIASIGTAIIANFPVNDDVYVHMTGAFLSFTSALIYCFLQSWMSYRLSPQIVSSYTVTARMLLSVLCITAYITGFICGGALGWDATEATDDPLLQYRRIGAGCEWFLVFALSVFFLTYTKDLRSIDVSLRLLFYDRGSKMWAPEITNDVLARLHDLSYLDLVEKLECLAPP